MKQASISLITLLLFSISLFAQRGLSSDAMSFSAGLSPISATVRSEAAAEKMGGVSSAALSQLERRAFELINRKRGEKGLPPLEWNDDLANVARYHSRHMAEFKFFSHKDNEGLMVNDRADKFGLHDWRAIGENIAFNRGFEDPVEMAIENWMGSRTHRENLLSQDWIDSAIGLAVSDDGAYYFTQVFLLKK
jgi:uncharacterized protein YkwD